MSDDTGHKLSAARTRLLLDQPFLGTLVLRLEPRPVSAPWCSTVGTDARAFYYNPDYLQHLSIGQVEFLLAHEALHCALSHFHRRGHRDRRRWDQACDFAINPILIDQGLSPPPDMPLMLEYAGMSAEEIYPLLGDNDQETQQDQHLYDGPPPDQEDSGQGGKAPPTGSGGTPPPQPLSPDEREQLAASWQHRTAAAARQAREAGRLHGELARLVEVSLHPVLPWRMLLARYLTMTGRDDYSWMRTSRREGEAVLPSLRSHGVNVTAVLDSSGSISDQQVSEFIGELDALKGQLRARVTVLACDTTLASGCPWVFEPWDQIRLPTRIAGGGGTSFRPPFAWQERQLEQPDLMIYFTDAEGEFPQREPPWPVLWLVKGAAPVPFGQRVQFND